MGEEWVHFGLDIHNQNLIEYTLFLCLEKKFLKCYIRTKVLTCFEHEVVLKYLIL